MVNLDSVGLYCWLKQRKKVNAQAFFVGGNINPADTGCLRISQDSARVPGDRRLFCCSVFTMVIHPQDEVGKPDLKLLQSQRSTPLRVVVSALTRVGEGGARKCMNLAHESSEIALNVCAIAWSLDLSEHQVDAVFTAGPLQCLSVKFSRIVEMDGLRLAHAGVIHIQAEPGKHALLGQDCIGDTDAGAQRSRRIE